MSGLFEGFSNSNQRLKFVAMGDDLLQAAQQVSGLAPALQVAPFTDQLVGLGSAYAALNPSTSGAAANFLDTLYRTTDGSAVATAAGQMTEYFLEEALGVPFELIKLRTGRSVLRGLDLAGDATSNTDLKQQTQDSGFIHELVSLGRDYSTHLFAALNHPQTDDYWLGTLHRAVDNAGIAKGATQLKSVLEGMESNAVRLNLLGFERNLLEAGSRTNLFQPTTGVDSWNALLQLGEAYVGLNPNAPQAGDEPLNFFLDTLWRESNVQKGSGELTQTLQTFGTSDDPTKWLAHKEWMLSYGKHVPEIQPQIRAPFYVKDLLTEQKFATLFPVASNPGGNTSNTVDLDIFIKNEKIGKILASIDRYPPAPNLQIRNGVTGSFLISRYSIPNLAQRYGFNHLNWLQIITADNSVAILPNGNQISSVPYIDPPSGGYDYIWADAKPWYWSESSAPSGTSENRINPATYLSSQSNSLQLRFGDFPNPKVGSKISFSTFLVADFDVVGSESLKTYDVLAGFSWTIEGFHDPAFDESYDDKNHNEKFDGGDTLYDKDGDRQYDEKGQRIEVTSLKEGAVFTKAYADLVAQQFPDYKKVAKLPTFLLSENLQSGQVDSFNLPITQTSSIALKSVAYKYANQQFDPIAVPTPFIAWTNNTISGNTANKPDTILGSFNQNNVLLGVNDDGNPFKDNLSSGLKGTVNSDGSIRLKVSGYPDFDFDGRNDSETGNYELAIKLYEEEFPLLNAL